MIIKSALKHLPIFSCTLALLCAPSFATQIELEQQALTLLSPSHEQINTSVNIVQLLSRAHYESISLNDESSEKVFKSYIKNLDPSRIYFTQSDLLKLGRYSSALDNALKAGNLSPGFAIYNLYQQRVEQRLKYLLGKLENDLDGLDFSKSEYLQIERDDGQVMQDQAALENLWRLQLKDSVLRLQLSDKGDEEIAPLLTKRYQNQLHRLYQNNNEDAFQAYINAFAQIYDPHTQYFSPRKAKNFDINMSLSLEGIGAVLQGEDEFTKVVRLVAKGPADKAGQLKPADKITGVGQGRDGEIIDVIGWRLDDVVDLIRGPKASVVRLEVIAAQGDGQSTIYNITRDEVKLEEQAAQKEIIEFTEDGLQHKIGVIKIPAFYIDFQAAQAGDPNYKSTTRDVKRLLSELESENIDGLVIDLRNNGGGSLQEANELTGLFIPQGPTVVVKDSRGRTDVQEDPDHNLVYAAPMAVIVNRLSASASEIFAGAMQDYQRAIIVGGQTFGKGTVQQIASLPHGQLKLTLAKFYRVSGQSTQHRGVIPDISFPALYDAEKVGESSLEDALAWDKIAAVIPPQHKTIETLRDQLTTLHKKRVASDAEFNYYIDSLAYSKELNALNRLALNRQTRENNHQGRQARQLEIQNSLRIAQGKAPLKDLNGDAEEESDASGHRKIAVKDDSYLQETGLILLDFINIKPKVAANDNTY